MRKLKPMKEMIDQIRGLGAKITEEGERAIEYVLTMQKDDPQFAPCKTFKEHIVKANEIAKSVKPEPHSPMDLAPCCLPFDGQGSDLHRPVPPPSPPVFSAMTKATRVFSTGSTRSVERESSATQTTVKGLASVMLASQGS